MGLDRAVFGSDAPQAPESFVSVSAQGLRDLAFLSAQEKHAVAQATAQSLLPRLVPSMRSAVAGPLPERKLHAA